MSDRYFLDTNILVYSFEETESGKKEISRHLISRALGTDQGLISCQVVQEFMYVALNKWQVPMTSQMMESCLDTVLNPLCRIFPSPSIWREALDVSRRTTYRFYDSMIVAAALQSDVDILYSEDLQHGRTLGRMAVVNPFL